MKFDIRVCNNVTKYFGITYCLLIRLMQILILNKFSPYWSNQSTAHRRSSDQVITVYEKVVFSRNLITCHWFHAKAPCFQ